MTEHATSVFLLMVVTATGCESSSGPPASTGGQPGGKQDDATADSADGGPDAATLPQFDPPSQPTRAADGLFGVNINPREGAPSADALAEAGVQWVRFEWQDGCDGAADAVPQSFPLYDPVVEEYRAADLKLLVIIDYASAGGVPWSHREDAPWDAYAPGFARCAAAIASHYASPPFTAATISAYEIWNEPDNPPGNPAYDVYVPPGAFGRMFALAAQEIRSAVREASGAQAPLPKIITGGVDSGPHSGYLEAALSVMGEVVPDGVGVHSYGTRPDPDWPSPTWGFTYIGDDLDTFYAAAALPLWITEFGTSDNSIQAEFISRFYARMRSDFEDMVPHAILFSWTDSRAGTWGLFDEGGGQKASYCAFRQAALSLQQCGDAQE